MFNRLRARTPRKVALLAVTTLLISNMAVVAANSTTNIVDSYQIPNGAVLQRTIYNLSEFAGLNQSSADYQIIYGGNRLITLGSELEYKSSQSIPEAGGAWTSDKDGSIIGITGCTAIAFGMEDCASISNFTSGRLLFKAQDGNPIDPHELLIDAAGNYWFLTAPVSDCSLATQLCAAYKIPQSKTFSDCQVNEVSPSGVQLYTWKASEHIPAASLINSYAIEAARGKYVDLFHCNSIDLVDQNSILISSRNTNSIFLVNLLTGDITWKFGGRYWPGVSLLATGFGGNVGSETIGQHDARALGNGVFSFYDDNSHAAASARGIEFRVVTAGNTRKAIATQIFANPTGGNALCTGSTRRSDLGNTVVGWGCSLNAITLFDKQGNPIVSLDRIKTDSTAYLYPNTPLLENGVDWGPDFNYLLSYRVIPVIRP